jgi:hypothetical protein
MRILGGTETLNPWPALLSDSSPITHDVTHGNILGAEPDTGQSGRSTVTLATSTRPAGSLAEGAAHIALD